MQFYPSGRGIASLQQLFAVLKLIVSNKKGFSLFFINWLHMNIGFGAQSFGLPGSTGNPFTRYG